MKTFVLSLVLLCLAACGAVPFPSPLPIACDVTIAQPASVLQRFTGGPTIFDDTQMGVVCSTQEVVTSAAGSCAATCAPLPSLMRVCDAAGIVHYLGASGGIKYGTIIAKGFDCPVVVGPLVDAEIKQPLDCVSGLPTGSDTLVRAFTGPVNCSYPQGLPN